MRAYSKVSRFRWKICGPRKTVSCRPRSLLRSASSPPGSRTKSRTPLNFVNNFSGVSIELIDELQEALGRVKSNDKTRTEITELTNTLRDNLDKIVQHGRRADA